MMNKSSIESEDQMRIYTILMLWVVSSFTWAGSVAPSAEVSIERLTAQTWRVNWSFDKPVDRYRVYPPNLSFRDRSWKLISKGFVINETPEGGVVSADGQGFDGFAIEFEGDSDFDPKTYVPVLPYSGGGAAIYTGHFSGDAYIDSEWLATPTTFHLTGLENEATLLPSWTSESSPTYVYFGEQKPQESDHVVMVIDPQMPSWLRETFTDSVPPTVSVFSERLGLALHHKPLVLVAAGELEDFEGYSVKGAGLEGQFTIMLRGKDLLTESDEQRKMFQKMIAHELFHVWQNEMPGGAFNPEQPWLHEGSADALAVAGLVEAGVWSDSDSELFHQQQKQSCADALAGSDLSSAAGEGNWTAIYSCGYLEFVRDGIDPFELWQKLTQAAVAAGSPYTQEMLVSIRDSQ
jgi:hypothetical protein